MLLHHSFPRGYTGDRTQELEYGLKILENICSVGLLLTYEQIRFPFYTDEGEDHKKATLIDQRRLCFTSINQAELKPHSAVFGPFSIAIDVETLRSIGGFPVVYLPRPTRNDTDVLISSLVGSNFIHSLRDIVILLQEVSHLQELVSVNDDLHEEISVETSRTSGQITLHQVSIILDYLKGAKDDFVNLLTSLQFASNFFYHADDSRLHRELRSLDLLYYLQREWRVVSGVVGEAGNVDEALTEEEEASIEQISPRMCETVMLANGNEFKGSQLCRKISKLGGLSLGDIISQVFLPLAVKREATEILLKYGWRLEAVTWISYDEVLQFRNEVREASSK